ncbi:DUF1993 family protein [Sphingomonadaceae bacterium jetA1]|jgi:hypothetical protein|uniref:DUF1993 family protein n=1 Tax=Facivitalis istanbulensis TaxID=3075838 RepID=UPI003497FE49
MSLTKLLVPTYTQMLGTIDGLLAKAQREMPERAESLPSARLAPNILPLASQVRLAACQVHEAMYKLSGFHRPRDLDDLLAEAYACGEAPGSLADARKRMDEALVELTGLDFDSFDISAPLPVEIELPGGIVYEMTGAEYVRDWALPQFYYHVITAYSILRSQGVEIREADFMRDMAAYIRRGSRPEG